MFHINIQIIFEPEKSTGELILMQVVAPQNTWLHQRRKRRQQQHVAKSDEKAPTDDSDKVPEQNSQAENQCSDDKTEGKDEVEAPEAKRRRLDGDCEDESDKANDDDKTRREKTNSKTDQNISEKSTVESSSEGNKVHKESETNTQQNLNVSIEDIGEYVVKCTLTVRKSENDVRLEMLWIDGESKELLHQLMQLFKNKLK